jgi:hypothetical protein
VNNLTAERNQSKAMESLVSVQIAYYVSDSTQAGPRNFFPANEVEEAIYASFSHIERKQGRAVQKRGKDSSHRGARTA